MTGGAAAAAPRSRGKARATADAAARAHTRTPRAARLFLLLDDVGTAQATSAAGGNETDLLARGGPAGDGGRVANVLLVTTTVGVVHGVHGHTTNLWVGKAGASCK